MLRDVRPQVERGSADELVEARLSAKRARPAGCLRPSRSRPACAAGSRPGTAGSDRSWYVPAAIISDVIRRGRVVGAPLIATDGLRVLRRGPNASLGQRASSQVVTCSRRASGNNRMSPRVERRVKIAHGDATEGCVVGAEDLRDPRGTRRSSSRLNLHHSWRLRVPAPRSPCRCPMRSAAPGRR